MKTLINNCQIVYPRDNELLEYYASLIKRKAKDFSVVCDDNKEVDHEIVIGNTNRSQAVSFENENGYSITTKGTKIFINAFSDEVLYFAVNYYIEYGMTVEDDKVSLASGFNKSGTLDNYRRDGWKLGLPFIEDGVIAPAYNTGTGMADDRERDTVIDSHMHLVSEVGRDAFESYAKKLELFGFMRVYSSRLDQNELLCYRLGMAYAYINCIPSKSYITVVWDKSSNCEVVDIDRHAEQTGKTVFYQYSIDYEIARLKVNDVHDWGIFYIVKLQDNSLILIDGGGALKQGENEDRCLQGLCDFLYTITGQDQNEPLHLRMWHFTHSDSDHTGKSYAFLRYLERKGYKAPVIDSLAFNFPSARGNARIRKDPQSFEMINYMSEKYPSINYIKLHTGMVFNIGEVKIEMLGTVENCVNLDGRIPDIYSTNCTCSLFRFTIGNKTILMCGDVGRGHAQYLALYSDGFMKSDVLQVSHHGINVLPALYDQCNAEYALVPNSVELMVASWNDAYVYYSTLVEPDKLHYAGDYTTALEIEGSKMTLERIPRYDNPMGKLD